MDILRRLGQLVETMSFKEFITSLYSSDSAIEEICLKSRNLALKCKSDTNAFLQVFSENQILEQVSYAKRLISNGHANALTGVPIAVKENILIKGFRASAASKMLDNFIAPYDAFVIRKLKEAGAVIIGTTNMDEFAMGSSSESSYYGPVRNSKDTNLSAGGSSGGSAVAVSYGVVPVALGTDTGGSVRQPASFCGVVGYKPSYGKVSRRGVIAFSSSLDQVGVFSIDPVGAAATLEIIEGLDCQDSTSEEMGLVSLEKILSQEISLKEFKIATMHEVSKTKLDEMVSESWSGFQNFVKSSCETFDEVSVPSWNYSLESYYLICCSEAYSNLSRYDGVRYGYSSKAQNLKDHYVKTRSEGFGKEVKQRLLLGTIALSHGHYDDYFKRAAQVRRLICDQLCDVFKTYDFLVLPTTPTVAFGLSAFEQASMEMYENDIFTVGVNLAGLPAISIPARSENKLPCGIQILGPRGSDQKLLMFASKVLNELNSGALS